LELSKKDIPAEDVCMKMKDLQERNLKSEDNRYYPIKGA
jgi:hypothetical protein